MSSVPSWNCPRTESCERSKATGSMPSSYERQRNSQQPASVVWFPTTTSQPRASCLHTTVSRCEESNYTLLLLLLLTMYWFKWCCHANDAGALYITAALSSDGSINVLISPLQPLRCALPHYSCSGVPYLTFQLDSFYSGQCASPDVIKADWNVSTTAASTGSLCMTQYSTRCILTMEYRTPAWHFPHEIVWGVFFGT